jgi:putative SbcD/Mre11-related phosphoesterase
MKDILFAYDEPAAIIRQGAKRYLVVGDLHIGRELKLAKNGIKIYGSSELMADRIIALMKMHKAKGLVILGDVKDSIIRPDTTEIRIIHSFFKRLSGYELILVQGNHDAGLSDVAGLLKVKEYKIGKVGLTHGNALPSEELMQSEYIIAGHDHPAVMVDIESGGHLEKAWIMLDIKPTIAAKSYKKPNKKIKLILMPAFNDLITGTDIGKGRIMNALVRRGMFNLKSAKIYDIKGQLMPLGL